MSKINYTYRGPIAPVFTIFHDDGSLNLDIVPKYAKYLAEEGVKGVLVNGTLGEGVSMSLAERKLVAEAWAKATKGNNLHLMIQVGGAPLPDVIELAKHAESLRVDSILCLPELYFKPTTIGQLIDYLKIVGNAAPKTPLLYYHIPMFTDVNIHMGRFLESIGDKLSTFVGIKFTSANLEECAQALHADNKKYVVFLGNDQLINPACTLGLDSFILTTLNIFPRCVQDIIAANNNGNIQIARHKQELLLKAILTITKYGNWVETMKSAMSYFTSISAGSPRAPLKPISPEAERAMREDASIKSLLITPRLFDKNK